MDSILQDLRYAGRRLRSDHGFTMAVLLTLAVGIGATAATFSVVNATVLEPLPFPQADRLVRLREVTPQGEPFSLSEPDYLDFARRLRTLDSVAAMRPLQLTMTDAGDPQQLEAAAVTSSVFPLLGINPALGRTLGPDDDTDGRPAMVAVMSHALWSQRFGADRAVIGRVVRLDGKPFTIVGVLPSEAVFPAGDVWIPLGASTRADRTDRWLDAIGRLAPGATIAEARAEALVIAAGLAREHREMQGWTTQVLPLADWLVGPGLRRMVWLLLGAVALLLVLACANISGLLMVRAVGRRGEMAVRAALGAGRGRLVRQLLTESLLLSVAGGALGIVVAVWLLDAFSAIVASVLPLGRTATLDGRVLGLTTGVVLLCAIGFGLAPAMHAAGPDLHASLRPASGRATPGSRRSINALVGVQVALAMVLLVGSCLLAGSYARLAAVDVGFDAANVLTVPLSLPAAGYPEPAAGAFYDAALADLSRLPGIEGAAATATNPFRQWGYANDVTPEDRAATAPASGFTQAGWRAVTPGFFKTLKVPVFRGRSFTAGDRDGAPGVVVISRSLAERLWPGQNGVGRRVYWGGIDGHLRTVVGVVGDIRDVRPDAPPAPMVYLPYAQLPLGQMTILLRTRPGWTGIADAVRREIRALDPTLPVPEVRWLDDNRAASVSAPRFRTILLALFGSIALLLAAVGLYAVVASSVAQRTREIAIRVAIGAQPSQVVSIFFRRGLRLTLIGGLAGLLGAVAVSGVLRSLLFETDARDPRLFALAAGFLAVVALVASYMPARRAARLDPLPALTREQL